MTSKEISGFDTTSKESRWRKREKRPRKSLNESVCGRPTFDSDEHGAVSAEDLRFVKVVGSDARVEAAVFRGSSENKEG